MTVDSCPDRSNFALKINENWNAESVGIMIEKSFWEEFKGDCLELGVQPNKPLGSIDRKPSQSEKLWLFE